jgi:hypothetical protein
LGQRAALQSCGLFLLDLRQQLPELPARLEAGLDTYGMVHLDAALAVR